MSCQICIFARKGKSCECSGEQHRPRLGDEQNASAVESVGGCSAQRGKKQYRDLRCEPDSPEEYHRTGHPIDKPALGYRLHPGSREGHELAGEK